MCVTKSVTTGRAKYSAWYVWKHWKGRKEGRKTDSEMVWRRKAGQGQENVRRLWAWSSLVTSLWLGKEGRDKKGRRREEDGKWLTCVCIHSIHCPPYTIFYCKLSHLYRLRQKMKAKTLCEKDNDWEEQGTDGGWPWPASEKAEGELVEENANTEGNTVCVVLTSQENLWRVTWEGDLPVPSPGLPMPDLLPTCK